MSSAAPDAVLGVAGGGGTSDLLVAYAIATAAMWAGLHIGRAPVRRYFTAPMVSIAVVVLGGMLWSFIAHAIPRGMTREAGAVFLAGLGFLIGRWIPPVPHDSSHKRGAYLNETAGDAASDVRRPARSSLTLAGIAVPPQDESKHFKLIGTTGTGKSTAIRELLTGALGRGDRAVIADPDAGYLLRFYDPDRGDVILNPFDPRSRKWDLFGEIRNPYDFEQLARSLIPDGAGEDRVWNRYAQTLLSAVMRQAHRSGIRDTQELYRLVTAAPVEELRILAEGTPAQAFVAAGNERMWGSIRSVTTAAVAALDFINAQRSELLSIRRWVKDGTGVLFLPYQADQIAALRAVISTWMRIAIVETMSLPEGDARLWFVVDELDALGQIDGLKDALARLRKFGGRCVLGFQSIAQVSGTYGRSEAETIVENCGNTLILRCSASEHGGTAQFASKLIGEREVIRQHVSQSRRPTEFWATKTIGEQQAMESVVLSSEIEQLPDLHGFLKFASTPGWTRVRLRHDALKLL
jgi:type IV secretory pathway TraG/TraD family ATPase VirD4